jgi:hypothetical protein
MSDATPSIRIPNPAPPPAPSPALSRTPSPGPRRPPRLLRSVVAAVVGVLLVAASVPGAAAAVSAGPEVAVHVAASPSTATTAPASTTGTTANAACADGPGVTFTDSLGSFGTYVEWMVCQGITAGYRDNTFRINRSVTRGEVAAFLYRMSGATYAPTGEPDFGDVAAGDSFYPAVMWMRSQGITTGYRNGTYGKSLRISRGELAALLYRYAGEPAVSVPQTHPFSDVRTSAFYSGPTAWLSTIGVSGYTNGTFRPDRDITRGETAKFQYLLNQAAGPTVTRPRWTEIRLNLYSGNDWKTSPILAVLPPQTRVQWVRDDKDLALVEVGDKTGWVNKRLLGKGQPGAAAKPFARPATFEQKAANNIAKWCWAPTIKTTTGSTSFARMRFQYFASGQRILIDKSEELEITTLIPDPNHVSSKAVQLHECAHLLQYRAYGYIDAVPTGTQLSPMDRDLNKVYQDGSTTKKATTQGVEHMADCMAEAMGAQRVTAEYTVGYGGECTPAHLKAARQLIAGQRFSTPSVVDSVPEGRAVPIAPWQTAERSDVPVVATNGS